MAGDAFQKFKDSTNRAITKISVKTSSTLEKSKIKMHIESLTNDVQKMTTDIGEELYSLWIKGDASIQSLEGKLEAIKQKKSEIEDLTTELSSIDDRDNEILGIKTEAAASQKPCCPNCNAECDEGAKFCRKCGYKLQ